MSLINQYFPSSRSTPGTGGIVDLDQKKKKSLISQYFPTQQAPVAPPKKSFFQRAKEGVGQVSQAIGGGISGIKDLFKRVEPSISSGISKLVSSNESIINKAEQELNKKIEIKRTNFEDTSGEERQLNLIRVAKDPGTDPAKKQVITDYLRLERAGKQVAAGVAGFGANILDVLTQVTEREMKADIARNRKLFEATGNQLFKQQADALEESTKKFESKDLPTRTISEKVKRWSQETSVENPDWVEKVAQGAGSMIGFAAASLATRGGNVPYLLESFSEAGATYEDNRKQGKSIEESSRNADAALVANLILNKFLNIFDVDGQTKKKIVSVVKNASTEGLQEGGQQIISNVTTGRPWDEGVLESAGIGATLGGGATFVLPSGEAVKIQPKEATEQVSAVRGEEGVTTQREVATSGVQIAEKGIYADLTPAQMDFLKDEVKNIEFTKEDKPRLSPREKLEKSELKKVSLEELRQESPNLDRALSDFEIKVAPAEDVAIEGAAEVGDTIETENVSASVIKVENQPVFRGSKGEVVSETKNFNKVLTVKTNQYDLLKELADQGNVKAKEHIDSLPKGVKRVDFTIADPIIREEFQDEFDAIQYNNEQLPQIGKEFHELSTNRFYAENELTAEQYAKQNRGGKKVAEKKIPVSGKKKVEKKPTTKKVIKRTVAEVEGKKVFKKEVVEVPIKETKAVVKEKVEKPVTERKIENIKSEKDVKKTLRDVREELEQAVVEAEATAIIAQEKRAGLNTNNVAKLKRVVSLNKKFREGDIETIRKSKSGDLLNSVIENVQEVHPEMSEQEAFDFAMDLPTKADEKTRNKTIVELEKKEKKLSKYLEQLKQKQLDLDIEQDEALANEWSKALAEQEKLISIVRVPRSQLPVGEGKVKISRLEARTKDKLSSYTEAEIEELGLSTYKQVNKKENIAKASKFVAEDPDKALRVVKGEIEPPEGILTNSVYVALRDLGAADTNIATKVASLGATRMGQEISILSEIDKDSPVSMMESIVKTRVEAFEKRTKKKASDKIKSEKKKVDQNLKAPSARQWDKFLQDILC